MDKYQVCTNCVMDTTDPDIRFDENGRCDHCNNFYNVILPSWHTDEKGYQQLTALAEKIKLDGKGKKYDCLIGLSGGLDSSYLTYLAVEKLGLRPLTFSVDTGWNLNIANENVDKVIKGLNLDMVTLTVDWEEMRDLQLAFFESQVPYQDFPQDHAIFAGLYNYAAVNGFKYVLTGGNYSTECVRSPIEWAYFNDIRFMKNIHKLFGKKKLVAFPLCGMLKYRIYYRYIKGMQRIWPLNYIPYRKEEAAAELKKQFGWAKYDNKHYENIFTRFYEGYWLPKRFGYDTRRYSYSSLILTQQMTRAEALNRLAMPPYDENIAMEDMHYITNKLGVSKNYLMDQFDKPKKTFRDYKNSSSLIKSAIKTAILLGVEKRNFR